MGEGRGGERRGGVGYEGEIRSASMGAAILLIDDDLLPFPLR